MGRGSALEGAQSRELRRRQVDLRAEGLARLAPDAWRAARLDVSDCARRDDDALAPLLAP